MSLLKNGIDLHRALNEFIDSSKDLVIFVPYIRSNSLRELIGDRKQLKAVIVRWDYTDLLIGASDLDLYPYLREKEIPLFRNNRLHLKAFLDCYKRAFIGSANISQRALNFPEIPNYNYELGVVINNMSLGDRLYFHTIEAECTLITDDIYKQLKQQLAQVPANLPKEGDLKIEVDDQDKSFLISALPMSIDIETLTQVYEHEKSDNEIDLNCALHDLAIYNIPFGLDKAQLLSRLKVSFFNHPFVRAFLENLDSAGEIYFGRAKEWIQENCSDVPTPRKWEITFNIQILYRWVVYLSDGVYDVDRPNYSERLFIVKNI